MEADYRSALKVRLLDNNVFLNVRAESEDGIFSEFDEPTWRVNGYTLAQALNIILDGGEPFDDEKLNIEIEAVYSKSSSGRNELRRLDIPVKILACVRAPQLLDLDVLYKGWRQQITYCGRFVVEWDIPDRGIGSADLQEG